MQKVASITVTENPDGSVGWHVSGEVGTSSYITACAMAYLMEVAVDTGHDAVDYTMQGPSH